MKESGVKFVSASNSVRSLAGHGNRDASCFLILGAMSQRGRVFWSMPGLDLTWVQNSVLL